MTTIKPNVLASPTETGEPCLGVYRLDPRAKLPVRAHETDVGWDVHAFLLTESGRPSKKAIGRTETARISTGLILKPHPGYYIQVCSRSGLATRSVFIANAPGIIDPDYTGELQILLHNSGYETFWVEHDFRIAQIVLAPIVFQSLREISEAPISKSRGEAGFGSSGT